MTRDTTPPASRLKGTAVADSVPAYSAGEEIANVVTHGLGALLSVGGLIYLVVFAVLNGNGYHIVSCSIFGATLIMLYSTSTFYHLVRKPKMKKLFRALDHSSIFLLIAGTYTPFTLVTLNGSWGWTLFGLVWGLAVSGIAIETLTGQRFRRLSLFLYVAMGWLIIVAAKPLFQGIAPGGLILLVCGGLCYTLGVVFYIWKSLDFNHAIWHLFVLAGSALHYFAVFYYVIP